METISFFLVTGLTVKRLSALDLNPCSSLMLNVSEMERESLERITGKSCNCYGC